MKKIKPFILPIIILIAGIILTIIGVIKQHEIYMLEFNKQIETFGYYKEDIHLLDLWDKNNAALIYVINGFMSTILSITWILIETIKKGFKKQ